MVDSAVGMWMGLCLLCRYYRVLNAVHLLIHLHTRRELHSADSFPFTLHRLSGACTPWGGTSGSWECQSGTGSRPAWKWLAEWESLKCFFFILVDLDFLRCCTWFLPQIYHSYVYHSFIIVTSLPQRDVICTCILSWSSTVFYHFSIGLDLRTLSYSLWWLAFTYSSQCSHWTWENCFEPPTCGTI